MKSSGRDKRASIPPVEVTVPPAKAELPVTLVAALLVIGAPFLVSMRLHEKSSRAYAADAEAELVAVSVAASLSELTES